jgi:hypothetical protein
VADDRRDDDIRHRLAGIKDLWTDLKSAETSTHSNALMDSFRRAADRVLAPFVATASRRDDDRRT